MSWIALTDLTKPVFNIRGIGVPADAPGARPSPAAHEILPTGTLMVEFAYHREADEPWTILDFGRHREWRREMRLAFVGRDRLRLSIRQGAARSHAEIAFPPPVRDSRVRVSFSWNAPRRSGRLTVECLDSGRLFQSEAPAPVPLPVADVKALMRNGRATTVDKAVRFLAVSDEIEPIGFGAGLAAGTPVETPDGPVPVDRLRLGDAVVTARSGPQRVRWIGRRTVPALGGLRPVRLRAPYFGLSKDLVVAPDHRVRIDLEEASYFTGQDELLIPASAVVDGTKARREARHRLVTYYQVLLDTHDCILHDGLWSESLFVGTIARQPELLRASVLADLPPSAIPSHRPLGRPELSDFQVRSLAASLLSA